MDQRGVFPVFLSFITSGEFLCVCVLSVSQSLLPGQFLLLRGQVYLQDTNYWTTTTETHHVN